LFLTNPKQKPKHHLVEHASANAVTWIVVFAAVGACIARDRMDVWKRHKWGARCPWHRTARLKPASVPIVGAVAIDGSL
jgi:hypothetical protein